MKSNFRAFFEVTNNRKGGGKTSFYNNAQSVLMAFILVKPISH